MTVDCKQVPLTHEVFCHDTEEWLPCAIIGSFVETRLNLAVERGGFMFGCSKMFVRPLSKKKLKELLK